MDRRGASWAVVTPGGTVTADWLVLATNGYTDELWPDLWQTIIPVYSGIVATEHEEREITVGDVVHIKAGEKHWHGAKQDTTLSHITITTADSQSRR